MCVRVKEMKILTNKSENLFNFKKIEIPEHGATKMLRQGTIIIP